ncbi:MAG: hypothetical protein OEY78_12770 [Gammaproteobacteria bacterium]|nr:hypothetical protein [Gammaproteobacteria bacterium]
MNALRWIKDSFVSILLASVGILAVLLTHFRHKSRQLKDKVKVINANRKAEKLAIKGILEEAKRREAKEAEIMSDDYDPRDWFSRNNRP